MKLASDGGGELPEVSDVECVTCADYGMKLPAGGEEEVDLMMKASMTFSNGVAAALTSCPYALPETEGANCQFFIECQGSDGTLRFEYASMEGSDGSEVVNLGGQGTIEKRWLVSEVGSQH